MKRLILFEKFKNDISLQKQRFKLANETGTVSKVQTSQAFCCFKTPSNAFLLMLFLKNVVPTQLCLILIVIF